MSNPDSKGARPAAPDDGTDGKDDPDRVVEVNPGGTYGRLNCVLGRGSCKVVWKAINLEDGIEVAWNCVKPSKGSEYAELQQEVEILKRIRHPNIIAFQDAWLSPSTGDFVFVTELMTSGTLRTYLRRLLPVKPRIIRRWARQILKGLRYLHSHNPPIIHRDLKCDNIFINGNQGEAKIGDLGTAKMKAGQKYTLVGTPEFMAPEMYEDRGYDGRVDVYAFGMCLLEMATGEYPYAECKNAAQIYKKVTNRVKPECLARVQDPVLSSLIHGCIAPVEERLILDQIFEHPFFSDEPELCLLAVDPSTDKITMQLSFQHTLRPPIRFDFYTDSDTAEAVVQEMINERYLGAGHEQELAGEINRIVRESRICSASVRKQPAANLSDHMSRLNIRFPNEEALPKEEQPLIELNSNHTSQQRTPPSIELLVFEAARQARRPPTKAAEWLSTLKQQQIKSVDDLQGLTEEGWTALNLSVVAIKALRQALHLSTQ